MGGPATYTKFLHDELPKRRIETVVVTFDHVRHLPKVIRHIKFFMNVMREARDVDCIYAQDPVSVGVPSMVASVILRKPFLLKIVGDYAWEQGAQRAGVTDSLDVFTDTSSTNSHKQSYSLFVHALKFIQSFVARRATRIVVPSQYLKKIVTTWGIPSDKIHVVYNAFDGITTPLDSREHVRKSLGIDAPFFISVGRFVPWKGFITLIEVMKKVVADMPDAKLLIIGGGPLHDTLQKKILDEALTNNVMIVDPMPRAKVFTYIRAADAFVLNTQYEGLSHLLLEVMAIGTSIVTTNVGGNPELIQSGESGFLVDYNDAEALRVAMLTVIKMPDQAAQFTRAAERAVKAFSGERMLQGVIDQFNAIIPRHE